MLLNISKKTISFSFAKKDIIGGKQIKKLFFRISTIPKIM
jgi:hypothetical protein